MSQNIQGAELKEVYICIIGLSHESELKQIDKVDVNDKKKDRSYFSLSFLTKDIDLVRIVISTCFS